MLDLLKQRKNCKATWSLHFAVRYGGEFQGFLEKAGSWFVRDNRRREGLNTCVSDRFSKFACVKILHDGVVYAHCLVVNIVRGQTWAFYDVYMRLSSGFSSRYDVRPLSSRTLVSSPPCAHFLRALLFVTWLNTCVPSAVSLCTPYGSLRIGLVLRCWWNASVFDCRCKTSFVDSAWKRMQIQQGSRSKVRHLHTALHTWCTFRLISYHH